MTLADAIKFLEERGIKAERAGNHVALLQSRRSMVQALDLLSYHFPEMIVKAVAYRNGYTPGNRSEYFIYFQRKHS